VSTSKRSDSNQGTLFPTLSGAAKSVVPTHEPPGPRQLRLAPLAYEQTHLQEELGQHPRDPDDGLITRRIKPHSLQKSWLVTRYADIVSGGVARSWPVVWVELFAGPGRLCLDSHEFIDGSPLDALRVGTNFRQFIFSDIDPECVRALEDRARGRGQVDVLQGDANDRDLHDRIFRLIPDNAIVILYLDPEGLELQFSTIESFAARFKRRLDVLVNFSPNYIVRATMSGSFELPRSVLGRSRDDTDEFPTTRISVQEAFHELLENVGLNRRDSRPVPIRQGVTLYQVLIASRHERAIELFQKAALVQHSGQRALF